MPTNLKKFGYGMTFLFAINLAVNSSLDENDWQCKYERKMTCKMLEAQIAILRKIIKEIPLISAGKMALMSA